MVYIGALKGVNFSLSTASAVAVVGGLAVACFTKAFGVVFKEEPRSARAIQAREVAWLLRIPMILLALGCLAIAFLAPQLVGLMKPVLEVVIGFPGENIQQGLSVNHITLAFDRIDLLSIPY